MTTLTPERLATLHPRLSLNPAYPPFVAGPGDIIVADWLENVEAVS